MDNNEDIINACAQEQINIKKKTEKLNEELAEKNKMIDLVKNEYQKQVDLINDKYSQILNENSLEIENLKNQIEDRNKRILLAQQNSRYFVFDYLSHGELSEYIYMFKNKNIDEKFVKLLCYKILIALKRCHELDICHNKICTKNIMLDDNFNPIIIHLSEVTMNNESYKKDYRNLGLVLGNMITSGYFKAISFSEKKNSYFVKTNNNHNSTKSYIEEEKFWEYLNEMSNIKVSEEFKTFFDILVKSKNDLNVDDLLQNEWFNDIKQNQKIIEDNLKKEFSNYYNKIKASEKIERYNFDLKAIPIFNDNYNSFIYPNL
jgi:hypothetical protein